MSDDVRRVVAVIPKNSQDEVRVGFNQFGGYNLLDLRVFTEPRGGGERVATKKGVSLRIGLLPHLIGALLEAEREAVRLGLIEHRAYGPEAARLPQ